VTDTQQPVTVRWQGRHIQARTQDLRRALVYLIVLTRSVLCSSDPVEILMSFADSLQADVIRVGWLKQDDGWRRARANVKLSEVLMATLHTAACGLHLVGCVGARIGSGVAALEGLLECDASFLWWWRTGRSRDSWYYQSEGTRSVRLTEVFGRDKWRETSFVQFLMPPPEDVDFIRRHEPDVPHIGGPHEPKFTQPLRPDVSMDDAEEPEAPDVTMSSRPPPPPPPAPPPAIPLERLQTSLRIDGGP